MELILIINISVILLIAFFVLNKKVSTLENIFLLLISEFVFSSYCAIIDINFDLWMIDSRMNFFINFKIFEIIILPLLIISYFNLITLFTLWWKKFIFLLVAIAVFYSLEWLLVKWSVITYKDWHPVQSLMAYAIILGLVYISYVVFRRVLMKDGVMDR
ncbi:hypothetical protein [Aquibacillus saliphilus]|uniref:hypothetical protein n=1 Tax=Aquibacillus saliphilus TaxID=1909422 RepID=UPI001CF03E82|nr:hypothetical protein [Aquibacillus saliphilus]